MENLDPLRIVRHIRPLTSRIALRNHTTSFHRRTGTPSGNLPGHRAHKRCIETCRKDTGNRFRQPRWSNRWRRHTRTTMECILVRDQILHLHICSWIHQTHNAVCGNGNHLSVPRNISWTSSKQNSYKAHSCNGQPEMCHIPSKYFWFINDIARKQRQYTMCTVHFLILCTWHDKFVKIYFYLRKS